MFFFKKLREKVADPRKIEIEELLSEAYLYWTSFNFKAALKKFEILLKKIEQYNVKINKSFLENNFKALKILNSEDTALPEKLSDKVGFASYDRFIC